MYGVSLSISGLCARSRGTYNAAMADMLPGIKENRRNGARSRRAGPAEAQPARRKPLPRKTSSDDAYAAAKAVLLKGRKLDMAALAAQLGIGRATLYRWTGDRERLIRDVLAHFLKDTFQWLDRIVAQRKLAGAERIAVEIEEMMRLLTQSKAVRGLLRNEPDVALRILTGRGPGSLQEKSMARLLRIVELECASGGYRPRIDSRLLAKTVIHLVNSYVYGNTIAGMDVDLKEAGKVIRSLL